MAQAIQNIQSTIVRYLYFFLLLSINLTLDLATDLAMSEDLSVRFNRDIRPILSKHCIACHGPDEGDRQGDLRLDLRDEAIANAAIVPGNGKESEVYNRITTADDTIRMPPAEHSEPLTAGEIDILTRWIDEGANYETHWSFVSPQRPSIPASANDSVAQNPIDRLVSVELIKRGLSPNQQAEPAVLIRRVALALTGLPPPRAVVDRFCSDPNDLTYAQAVDELLQAPQYGEHWAAVWLDLARYADTIGYAGDEDRKIWPWRDLVISLLNDNLPFDEFTREVVAGDLIPGATEKQRLASAFHRNTLNNNEGGTDNEEFRIVAVKDRLSTTINTWMGLTIRCAECHSHKYDPISQTEYYQMLDFFNQTADTDTKDEAPTIEVALLASGTALPAPVKVPVAVDLTGESRRTTHLMKRGNFQMLGDVVCANTPSAFHPLEVELTKDRLALANWLISEQNPLTARVAVNRIWARLFGIGLVETEEDFGSLGIYPTHPELLDHLALDFIAGGWDIKRLIREIVSSSTYRQSSFMNEEKQAHDPRNLYLSRGPRFRLPAEVVRDQTLASAGLLSDKLYGPPVFPPSAIKRIVNSFTGGMDWKVSDGEDRYRRAIYTYLKRSQPHPLFETFDMTSRDVCNLRRLRTNTPLQSFMTLNDPAFIEAAKVFANSMFTSTGGNLSQSSLRQSLTGAWRQALIDDPEEVEIDTLYRLYVQSSESYASTIDTAALMAGVEPGSVANQEIVARASLTVCANVLFNCDAFLSN